MLMQLKRIGILTLLILPIVMVLHDIPPKAAPMAPHVPLAPGVHEGQLATMHWRLIDEKTEQGIAIERKPLNAIYYKDPDTCASDGSKVAPPVVTHLIRCLPFRLGDDTDNSVPVE